MSYDPNYRFPPSRSTPDTDSGASSSSESSSSRSSPDPKSRQDASPVIHRFSALFSVALQQELKHAQHIEHDTTKELCLIAFVDGASWPSNVMMRDLGFWEALRVQARIALVRGRTCSWKEGLRGPAQGGRDERWRTAHNILHSMESHGDIGPGPYHLYGVGKFWKNPKLLLESLFIRDEDFTPRELETLGDDEKKLVRLFGPDGTEPQRPEEHPGIFEEHCEYADDMSEDATVYDPESEDFVGSRPPDSVEAVVLDMEKRLRKLVGDAPAKSSASSKRRRGRPFGSKNKAKAKVLGLDKVPTNLRRSKRALLRPTSRKDTLRKRPTKK